MGDEPLRDEQIVPGKQDFGHDIAIVAIVFKGVFGAQIIKTICFGPVVLKRLFGIPGDHLIAILNEFEAYITARFYDVSLFVR